VHEEAFNVAGRSGGTQAGKGERGPVAQRCDAIRNVVLVGPAGSGKTTLVETLLVSAGVLSRAGSTLEGTTVTDFEEAEQRQQRSVALALAPLVRGDVKINLLDAPGYADFVGELRAGLRAADCAMFVIAANEGIDEPTRTMWRECADVAMPRAVVITKLDHARADYAGVVEEARAAFGDTVVPVYLREGTGLVGLLSDDHEHEPQRAALIEAVIEESEDETLMDRFLGGEEIDQELLVTDLERAVARGSFHPVIPVDSSTGVGAEELLDLIVTGFPSPLEHPLPEVFTPNGRR
jgi:elongation factor G